MGQIISFLSGKGGTGKSAVCAGIGCALAAGGKAVLCLDLNGGLPGLDLALGLGELPCITWEEVASGEYPLSKAVRHPQFEKLAFLSAPISPSPLEEAALQRLLGQAEKEFAYILLDCPAGLEKQVRLAAGSSHRVVVVSGYDPDSIRCAARVADTLELMGKEDVRLLINRADLRALKALHLTVDDLMDKAGLPLLGLVPEDGYVLLAAAAGKPLLKQTNKGAAAACIRIARRILGQSVPVKL